MKQRWRRAALFALLAGTIAAVLWPPGAPPAVRASVSAAPPAQRAASLSARKAMPEHTRLIILDRAERTLAPAAIPDPFAPTSWIAPAPPTPPAAVPVALAPEKPTLPALPFVYMGKLEQEAGQWIIYLARGEQTFSVRQGETFDEHYRYDGMENGSLVISYLPLAAKQLLPIAFANE